MIAIAVSFSAIGGGGHPTKEDEIMKQIKLIFQTYSKKKGRENI